MILLQSSQCVSACESLGDTGGMIFGALAFAWAMWQRYQKGKAVAQTLNANNRASIAESEREMYKQISLRPAGVPLFNFPTEMLAKMSVPSPEMLEPSDPDHIPFSPPDSDPPTVNEKRKVV